MQPSNPVEATKIELPSGKASGTWHDEIFELHFSIKNPGGAVQKKHYTSDMVAVGTSDLKIGVAMQRTMAQFGFYLITEQVCCLPPNTANICCASGLNLYTNLLLQPYSYTTLPTIFRFILHGDSPEQPDIFETHAENKPVPPLFYGPCYIESNNTCACAAWEFGLPPSRQRETYSRKK
jgi:hypothetical protein